MMAMEAQLVIDLLDELWFSNNTMIPKAKETNVKFLNQEREIDSRHHGDKNHALLRMPTLPSTLERVNTTHNRVKSLKDCNPKLRHSLSSLDHYRSNSSSIKSPERPPSYIKLERPERYLSIQHYISKEAYYRNIFKEKKRRSLCDLEYIEVQGFKDLGFVSEKRSAPWLVRKSGPPIFRHVDKKSTEDMKEQLKFWTRAVACNARKVS